MQEKASYYKSLPRKRMASGVLFLNDKGKILLVKPTYKDHWNIPGGVVDKNESPAQAAIREVKEELGLTLKKIEFLSVDYAIPSGVKDESLQFVFFGGVLKQTDLAKIKLEESEISEFRFASEEQARVLTKNHLVHTSFPGRLVQSMKALKSKKGFYLEDGKVY